MESLGVIILGASFDTVEDNKAFAQEHGFTYRLLSDTSKEVGAKYQVLREPGAPNENFPNRISYLIDPEGTIRASYVVSDPAGHATQVLSDLEQFLA